MAIDYSRIIAQSPRVGAAPLTLSPEDEAGILRKAARIGLSGVARVGNLLDLPGSMARDVIASVATGKFENPFDQLLPWNMTTADARLQPEEFNERLGITSPAFRRNHPVLSFGAGLGSAIATDPLTYLGLPGVGRLSQAGQVAKRAGILKNLERALPQGVGRREGAITTTLDKLMAAHAADPAVAQQVQQAASAMGLNMADISGQTLGRRNLLPGKAGQAFARQLDAIGDRLSKSAPVRGAAALFHAPFAGQTSYFGQKIAKEKWLRLPAGSRAVHETMNQLTDAREALNRDFASAFGQDIAALGPKTGTTTPPSLEEVVSDVLRWTGETKGDLQGAMDKFINPTAYGRLDPAVETRLRDFVDQVGDISTTMRDSIASKGGQIGTIRNFFTRQPGDEAIRALKLQDIRSGGRLLKTGPHASRRLPTAEVYASVVDDMLVDPALRDPNLRLADVANRIKTNYGQYLDPQYGLGRLQQPGVDAHANALAKYILKHPQKRLYTRDALDDLNTHYQAMMVSDKSLDAVHEVTRRNLETFQRGQTPLAKVVKTSRGLKFQGNPGDYVRVSSAFSAAGMDKAKAIDYLARQIEQANGLAAGSITRRQMAKAVIPIELADAIKGMVTAATKPEWQSLALDSIDTMTRLFKTGVTAHPANWVRNHYSGQFVNMAMSGEIRSPKDFLDYVAAYREAWRLRQNPAMTRSALTYNVIDPHYGSEGVEFSLSRQRLNQNPLNVVQSFREARAGAQASNPTEWLEAVTGTKPGALAGNQTAQAAAGAGRKIQTGWNTAIGTSAKANQLVEWQNRVPMWLYLQKRGWTPEAAAAKVRELQLDYRHGLAPFEKSVMRRLAPFYSFTRLISPRILETLKDRPAGLMGQMIRSAARMGGTDATTPEYVARGLSIPMGETPEGDKRFLAATGFPYEDTLSFAGSPQESMFEAASRMNPLIKGPAEWLTGTSLFQQGTAGGRPLEDLDPVMGRTLRNVEQLATGDTSRRPPPVRTPSWFEHLVSNSPVSRYATSLRTATDPRKTIPEKAVNLLTGARATTISPAAQDAILRERAERLAKDIGARDFTRTYLPDDIIERLPPSKRAEAENLKALLAILARRARERSEAAQLAIPTLSLTRRN